MSRCECIANGAIRLVYGTKLVLLALKTGTHPTYLYQSRTQTCAWFWDTFVSYIFLANSHNSRSRSLLGVCHAKNSGVDRESTAADASSDPCHCLCTARARRTRGTRGRVANCTSSRRDPSRLRDRRFG